MATISQRAQSRLAKSGFTAQSSSSHKLPPLAERRVLRLKAVGFKPHPHPSQKGGGEDEHEGKEQVQQFSFKVLADM